ncbi:MAG: CopG family transcriptional regulator [Nitrososphaerota archaeon]
MGAARKVSRNRKVTVKTGVSFPAELLENFDKILREMGIASRSQGLQEAIRAFITVNSWRLSGRENVAGVIMVHYSHDVKGLEEDLTDVQHDFMDIIPSALHLHLTEEDCLLVIIVKGAASRIRHLSERIRSVGKAKQVLPILTPIY